MLQLTSIWLTWLNCRYGSMRICVSESIDVVYKTLANEGADLEIAFISDDGDEITVDVEDVNLEDSNLTYIINLDLTESYVNMKKFNQLIEGWGIVGMNITNNVIPKRYKDM